VRVFLAGATGVIGIRVLPLLIAEAHTVAGMTRSQHKAEHLRQLGALPVVCDVFDAASLTDAVTLFKPEAVMHQLTDLPDSVDQLGEFAARNDRMRTEGTRNLISAAGAAKPTTFSLRASRGALPAAVTSSTRTSARYSMREESWFVTDRFTDPAPITRIDFHRTRGSTSTTLLGRRPHCSRHDPEWSPLWTTLPKGESPSSDHSQGISASG
jgi:nucleoside-diphosphate-sugar epimerase